MILLLASLSMLPALLLPAQGAAPPDVKRQSTVGKLLDREGKPWSGAEVHLYASQIPDAPRHGWQDHLVVRSGERGRFSARLVRGLAYTVFAVQLVGDEVRATGIREQVLPGQPIELQETRTNRRVRYRLEGQGAWKERGPLRFEVRLDSTCDYRREVREVDGVLQLPPLPGDYAVLRILDKEGRYVATRSMNLDPKVAIEPLPLLPPFEVRLECQGMEKKPSTPIPGARVYISLYRRFEAIGSTDEHGRLSIWVQKDPRLEGWPASCTLLILAPGYSESLLPLTSKTPTLDSSIGARDAAGMDLRWQARARPSLRGRLLDREGRPMAGRRLLLRSQVQPVRRQASINDRVDLPRAHTTDAQGRFEIPVADRLPGSKSGMLALTLVEGVRETILLTRDLDRLDTSQELTLGLADLVPVSFSLQGHPEGKPLLCHYLPVGDGGWRTIPEPMHVIAAGRGRFDLRLPRGRYLFAFEAPGCLLQEEVTLQGEDRPVVRDLEFPPTRRIRGRVVDAAGKPARRASIRWVPVASRARRRLASYLSPLWRSLRFHGATVGEDGAVDFRLPATSQAWQLSARWSKSARSTWFSSRVLTIPAGKADIPDLHVVLNTR